MAAAYVRRHVVRRSLDGLLSSIISHHVAFVAGARRFAVLALWLAASAQAAPQVAWIDRSGGDWTDGSNWFTGAAPGPADTAQFALGAPELYDVFLDASVLVTGVDDGHDRTRIVLGPNGGVLAGGVFSARIGVGLAAGQASWLHVHGGAVQTKNAFVGMVPFIDAELDLAGGVAWSADGFVILGLNGGGATLIVRDGASLATTASLQMLGGFSDELPIRCRFVGARTTGFVGGSLTTSAAVNIIDVHEGAHVEVDGDARLITDNQADVGGLEVRGRGSMLDVGGSLSIGGGLWGVVRVLDGGHLAVGADVLAGVTPGVVASRLEVDGGMVEVLGDIRLGSDPLAPSGEVDLASGMITVAGAIRTLEHDPFHSVVVAGPSTTTGRVSISSSWVSSGMTLHAGGVVDTPELAAGPGATVQCSGGGGPR